MTMAPSRRARAIQARQAKLKIMRNQLPDLFPCPVCGLEDVVTVNILGTSNYGKGKKKASASNGTMEAMVYSYDFKELTARIKCGNCKQQDTIKKGPPFQINLDFFTVWNDYYANLPQTDPKEYELITRTNQVLRARALRLELVKKKIEEGNMDVTDAQIPSPSHSIYDQTANITATTPFSDQTTIPANQMQNFSFATTKSLSRTTITRVEDDEDEGEELQSMNESKFLSELAARQAFTASTPRHKLPLADLSGMSEVRTRSAERSLANQSIGIKRRKKQDKLSIRQRLFMERFYRED